jgi:hypothetical protein
MIIIFIFISILAGMVASLTGIHFGYQVIVGTIVLCILLWNEDKIKNSETVKKLIGAFKNRRY